MSRSFTGILIVPYIGQPYFVPVAYCGMDLKLVPLDLNWSSYSVGPMRTAVGVSVIMASGVQPPIKQIAGVIIDNTACPVPVYVVFDSGVIITCAPFQQVFAPALSADLKCVIYADGFTGANSGATRVLLSDKPLPPFSNIEIQQVFPYWIASPSIQRFGSDIQNQNYGVPALGDQCAARSFSLPGSVGTAQNVFPIAAGGYYYLCGVNAAFVGVSRSGGGSSFVNIVFRNQTVTADQLLSFSVHITGGDPATIRNNVMDWGNFNVKLDATQGWELYAANVPGSINNGQFEANFVYTFNPNL